MDPGSIFYGVHILCAIEYGPSIANGPPGPNSREYGPGVHFTWGPYSMTPACTHNHACKQCSQVQMKQTLLDKTCGMYGVNLFNPTHPVARYLISA